MGTDASPSSETFNAELDTKVFGPPKIVQCFDRLKLLNPD
jgi:hypothetical protein